MLSLDNERQGVFNNRKRNNVQQVKGYQEPFEWYDKCSVRERNKGTCFLLNIYLFFFIF